jgi:hypothetical protein
MKRKLIVFIAALLLVCLTVQIGNSQKLKVTDLSGFPVCPSDSAFEGQVDSFSIQVVNLDINSVTVGDFLYVIFQNDSAPSIKTDTVFSVYIDSLQGQDTLNYTTAPYTFTVSRYKTGNNIVVVWPKIANDTSSTADSLNICVFFVPLQSLNILNVFNSGFFIFPNPVIKLLNLSRGDGNSIEYVRITNDIGQEILFRRTIEKQLDVGFLSEGFYFIEIKERNGVISRKKFLKL